MEAEAQIHSGALGLSSKVQLKSEKSKNMSKEVKTMLGIPAETVCLSLKKPTYTGQERNQQRTELGLLNVGDICILGADWGPLAVGQDLSLLLVITFGTHSLRRDTLLILNVV